MKRLIIKLICIFIFQIICNIMGVYLFFGSGIFSPIADLYIDLFVFGNILSHPCDEKVWMIFATIIIILFQNILIIIYKINPLTKKTYKKIYCTIAIASALYTALFWICSCASACLPVEAGASRLANKIFDIFYPFLMYLK